MEYISHSEYETEQIGASLAASLTPGSVIALSGNLGAGKTAFARGLAAALGYTGYVNSPTFTIVNEYLSGQMPIFHFDLYRLDDADSVIDIGWDDYVNRDGICIVEWSERALELFPKGTIYVNISFGELGDDRIVCISS